MPSLKKTAFLFFVLMCSFWKLSAEPINDGWLTFLVKKGHDEKVFSLYRENKALHGKHDYRLLQEIGFGLIRAGSESTDPQTQLMSLYGAMLSLNEDLYSVMENCLKSRYVELQLLGLSALAQVQDREIDHQLQRYLASPDWNVRLAMLHLLCAKKSPQALSQTESFMYKVPQRFWFLFPSLFAQIGTAESACFLKKLLNDPVEKVRIATILSIVQYHCDDLIPIVRGHLVFTNYVEQEAAAFAVGQFKDEKSIPQLKRIAKAGHSTASLAAEIALYKLGDRTVVPSVESKAKEGNLFAITALGHMIEGLSTLQKLEMHPDLSIRLNATISLIELNQTASKENLREIFIRQTKELGFVKIASPAHSLQSWKVTTCGNLENADASEDDPKHLQLKRHLLEKIQTQSEFQFIALADLILSSNRLELASVVISLLEMSASENSIKLLKKYQNRFGAPLIRYSCQLTLYRLKVDGDYSNSLKNWVILNNQEDLIRFEPMPKSEMPSYSAYELKPEEKAKLLISILEAFTEQQTDEAVDLLLDVIENGNKKNRYVFAGLLIRATQ